MMKSRSRSTERIAQRILAAAFSAAASLTFAPTALIPAAAAQTQLPPPVSYAPADARQDRIEELEAQLRQATADYEALQLELMQANREITRLRGMVGELAGVNQDAVASIADPDAPAAGEAGGAPLGGGANPSAYDRGAQLEGAYSGAQARASGTLGTLSESQLPAPSMPVRDAGDDFAAARSQLNNGQLAEAEISFADFLQRYPDDTNAAEARYWYAFTLLARRSYQEAAANFVTYLQSYGTSARAPEAQVRLGMALIGMGQQRQGCGAFNQLTARYPNAARNVRDLAAREARAAQCNA
ncbi:MAG: tetratricopeptide repeat protein [Hyphomonadaceae bacterium]|nr:tetratricopeptide repeat protein [Hyphomonadaceae bacterium]